MIQPHCGLLVTTLLKRVASIQLFILTNTPHKCQCHVSISLKNHIHYSKFSRNSQNTPESVMKKELIFEIKCTFLNQCQLLIVSQFYLTLFPPRQGIYARVNKSILLKAQNKRICGVHRDRTCILLTYLLGRICPVQVGMQFCRTQLE